jgi:tripartite-type tricarboxylate transporter receptor subunit TctC
MIQRRHCLQALAATAAWPGIARAAWPDKPIRIVVPYAPGGFTDIVSRLVAQKLTARLGQPVIVENKAGGSTAIAAEHVARSAPDGHTLIMAVTTTLSTNPFLFKKLPYKAADFVPVALTGLTPLRAECPPVGAGQHREGAGWRWPSPSPAA